MSGCGGEKERERGSNQTHYQLCNYKIRYNLKKGNADLGISGTKETHLGLGLLRKGDKESFIWKRNA